jgi:hypothetical protein
MSPGRMFYVRLLSAVSYRVAVHTAGRRSELKKTQRVMHRRVCWSLNQSCEILEIGRVTPLLCI